MKSNTQQLVQSRNELTPKCREFAKTASSENYLSDVAVFLCKNVGVSYVLIGYPEKENVNCIRTAALVVKGALVDNISYSLAGTPCENVMGRNCCYFPSGIQQMFPNDQELKDLSVESYIGFPLFGEDGNAIGLIVLMDTEMIPLAGAVEQALNALSARTSQELLKFLGTDVLQMSSASTDYA